MHTRTTVAVAALLTVLPLHLLSRPASAAEGDAPATAPPAPAAPQGLVPIPDFTGDLWTRSHLAGDFNGGRTALAEKGIQLDVDWTQYFQSIVAGGRDSDSSYGGHLDYLLRLDLMRMGVLPGALVTIRGESRYGQSVNGSVGTVLPANTTAFFPLTKTLDDGVPIAVTDLNYTQFLGENLAVVLGKLDTLDADPNEFASGRGKTQFMHANFLFDSVAALRLPYSTLGAGVLWLPAKNIKVNGSIINTQDSSTTSGFEGFGHGESVSGEVDTQYRLGNLPGGFNVGGLYSFDQDFTEVGGELIFQPGQGLSVSKKDTTWAVYASAWQYLYVADPSDKPIDPGNGEPDHQGFGLFARLGFADQTTNPVKWSASIGLGGKGMIPSRPRDTFGVGYYYTEFQTTRLSGRLGIDSQGQGFEAFYNIELTPAAHLTLDAQVQDTAFPRVDTAVVLGARLNLSF